MDVLKHAVLVVRDLDAEVLLHPLVPHGRQVARSDMPRDQVLLELEAQDEVEAVGRFVRLDPNQGWLHLVDRAVEVVELDGIEVREQALDLRVEP